jgi:hypothetical protein
VITLISNIFTFPTTTGVGQLHLDGRICYAHFVQQLRDWDIAPGLSCMSCVQRKCVEGVMGKMSKN